MNNGKICISVCAETADELIEQIKRAEDLADVIEIRFDCLEPLEIDKVLLSLNRFPLKSPNVFLATFRQREQGGKSKKYHIDFWSSSNVSKVTQWADFEFDLDVKRFGLNFQKEIRSFHLFNRTLLIHTPEFLNAFYEKLKTEYAESIFKVAVQSDDISDTIEIWNLLKRAKTDNKQIIPIAMGEAGKWTRILGLAHGAFMTYAALDAGKETASGQITARDLIETYRVKELDRQTEIYGIIGNPVSHSLSPYIHNAAFKFHNLNAVYIPFEVKNLDEFIAKFIKKETREIELNFKGFSVTSPHKQAIIKHLDSIDEAAEKIGAVNTIKIVDGKLYGFNTDAKGFIEPLLNSYGDMKNAKVAVIGAGGAARACVYALKQHGAEVTIFARDAGKAKSLADDFQIELKNLTNTDFSDYNILVNTTPLGMKSKAEGETPVLAEQIKNLHLIYDLVYIPFQTALMTEADKAAVPKIGGMAMLIAQAMEQQKIWTGKDAPMREMSREVLKRLS